MGLIATRQGTLSLAGSPIQNHIYNILANTPIQMAVPACPHSWEIGTPCASRVQALIGSELTGSRWCCRRAELSSFEFSLHLSQYREVLTQMGEIYALACETCI